LLQTILTLYAQAKEAKDYAQVDVLRGDLKAAGIAVKDTKAGISWAWVE
jgi:cysteinyl-tRNA synthetase